MAKNPSSSSFGNSKKRRPTDTNDAALPSTYGDTKIIALPRDPFWIYSYWEVSDREKSRLAKELSTVKFQKSKWILRVYDITCQDNKTAGGSFDIPIPENSGSWHINCGIPNRRWVVSIGLITPDGKFITVARSNTVATPPYGISGIEDETWGLIRENYTRQITEFIRSSGDKSSLNPARLMKERWEELMKLPSSKFISKHRGKKSR